MKLFTDFTHLEVPFQHPFLFCVILFPLKHFDVFHLVMSERKKSLKHKFPFCFQYLQGLLREDVPHILQKLKY